MSSVKRVGGSNGVVGAPEAVSFAELRDARGRLPDGFAFRFEAGGDTAFGKRAARATIEKYTYRTGIAAAGTLSAGEVFDSVGLVPRTLQISIEPRRRQANTGTLADFGLGIEVVGRDFMRKRLAVGVYRVNGNEGEAPMLRLVAGAKNNVDVTTGRGTFTVHSIEWGGAHGNTLMALHLTFDVHDTVKGRSSHLTGEFVYENPRRRRATS
jgi:hypothetical protein